MQIDGHHAATFVAARIAGFCFKEASTIAYAAQYVDDATNAGTVDFAGGNYLYARIASAHKMVDYKNVQAVQNHQVWIPFHFLPGNAGQPAGQGPDDPRQKLICRPDSPVARDMLRAAAQDMGTPRALHRLGIAMHVYADTFAHAGFVGGMNTDNQVSGLTSGDAALDQAIKWHSYAGLWAAIKSKVGNSVYFVCEGVKICVIDRQSPCVFIKDFKDQRPVGHLAADVYPDQPYLKWQYFNDQKQLVIRNNPDIYMQAIEHMVKALRAWNAGDADMDLDSQPGLDAPDHMAMEQLFRNQRAIDGADRHQAWLVAMARGDFSIGTDVPVYVAKGIGSWKFQALGSVKEKDHGREVYDYTPGFLTSDWKLFHDAIHAHRHAVVHDILPRYGICAA